MSQEWNVKFGYKGLWRRLFFLKESWWIFKAVMKLMYFSSCHERGTSSKLQSREINIKLSLFLKTYRIYSAISRDLKHCACRLGITRTKNKSKTPGYKPRPIRYYKTELLITGNLTFSEKKITSIVINRA